MSTHTPTLAFETLVSAPAPYGNSYAVFADGEYVGSTWRDYRTGRWVAAFPDKTETAPSYSSRRVAGHALALAR